MAFNGYFSISPISMLYFRNYPSFPPSIWLHWRRCLRKFCTWASRLTHASKETQTKTKRCCCGVAFLPATQQQGNQSTAENKTNCNQGNNKLPLPPSLLRPTATPASQPGRCESKRSLRIFSFSARWHVEPDGTWIGDQ